MNAHRFKTAAVVVGMHRSGTSAIAGVLSLTGFSAPRTLLAPSSVNERGFWESEPINDLNDAFFDELGSSWHGLEEISFARADGRRVESAKARTEFVLRKEFEPDSRPLIKDPRLCRLLPLWEPAIAELSEQAIYVITVRSPLEVARSLAVRNDFDPDLGCLLWARYYLDAEKHTRGMPRVWLTYDGLIADWRQSLKSMEQQFGEFRLSSKVEADVDEFVSAQLRHHQTADEQTLVELDRFPLVRETYRTLLNITRSGASTVDLESLDDLRAQFDAMGDTLSKVAENARLDRKRLTNARASSEKVSSELKQARRSLMNLDAVRGALEAQSIAQRDLEKRVESAMSALTEALRERSILEKGLSESVAEAAKERAAFKQTLADVRREAEQKRREIEKALTESTRERDAVNAENERLHAVAKAAADEFNGVIDLLRRDHELAQTELKDVKRKYRSTQHQLARDREKLRRTQEQLGRVQQEIEAIRRSRVWRIYSSLQSGAARSSRVVERIVGGGDRKRKADAASLLRSSSLFDREWYLKRYPDVAAAGVDPVVHYLESGWREGRDPGPDFATSSYLRANDDVARAGLNPLLHYLEFGYAEGRHIAELSRTPVSIAPPPDEDLPPAAECASFPLASAPPVRWRRAASLAGAPDTLVVVGQRVGIASQGHGRHIIENAFHELATLSGYASHPDADLPELGRDSQSCLAPIDIWFVAQGRLRSRWPDESGPLVVRAYQHDPLREGALALVGEGLSVSQTDFVDFNLANEFFPLLFVLCRPNGAIEGARLLAFPSLCRGGAHYPELVACERDAAGDERSAFDVLDVADDLAKRLAQIFNGDALRLIEELVLDLSGADGSELLFQPGMRSWLSKVMRLGIDPSGPDADKARERYLRNAAKLNDDGRGGKRRVVLPADTIPSIDLMTMPAGPDEGEAWPAMSVIVAEDDPAQPSVMLTCPSFDAACQPKNATGYPLTWPQFEDVPWLPKERLHVAAIRRVRRPPPQDAELLTPVAQGFEDPATNFDITWLAFPEDWDEDVLALSLEALAVQRTSKPLTLALVGDVPKPAAALAGQIFGDRVSNHSEVTAALTAVSTPLVGYLGANVVLHDPRTCNVLSQLLEPSFVISASCVLVHSERHGKGWRTSVADPGGFAASKDADPGLKDCGEARHFWRANYPVLRPPRDLWIARSSSALGWLERAGPMHPDEGLQLCTSLVTASYLAERLPSPAHLRPPASAELRALHSEVLFG